MSRIGVEQSPTRCPYCHENVKVEDQAWVACASCLARHHEDCWREGGRCSACSSEERLVRSATADAPPRPASRRLTPATGKKNLEDTWPTLVVARSGPGPRTIGEAIRAAKPGTRILVTPGIYAEGVVIDRAVAIVGDGPVDAIVIESASTDVLLMATDDALVRGVSLRGRAAVTTENHAVVSVPRGRLRLVGCDVASESMWPGVAVDGARTEALLKRCRVHDGRGGGVIFTGGAQGTIEDCEVLGNRQFGIAIKTGANPTVRGGSIRASGAGVFVSDGGRGTFVECEVRGHDWGVRSAQSGAATFERCRIHENKRAGCWFDDLGEGTLVECRVFANDVANVLVERRANPRLRGCRIQEGRGPGVLVTANGLGRFEECTISDNSGPGVEVALGGDPTVERCWIRRNDHTGVRVRGGGRGTFEACELSLNGRGAFELEPGSQARRVGNRE